MIFKKCVETLNEVCAVAHLINSFSTMVTLR